MADWIDGLGINGPKAMDDVTYSNSQLKSFIKPPFTQNLMITEAPEHLTFVEDFQMVKCSKTASFLPSYSP